MSKKNKEKRTRVVEFNGFTDSNADFLSVTYDSETDSFVLNGINNSTAKVTTSYISKTGKKKITNSVPCHSGITSINSTKDLLIYKEIFGIDTNSTELQGMKLSIACVYKMERKLEEYPMNFFCSFCIVNPKNEINPESIAWHIFLDRFAKGFNQDPIALITDSERNRHEVINKRQKSYYKNYILPKNVWFIYGSSDKKNDGLANAMVYLCDIASRKIINHINKINFAIPPVSQGDENFDGYFFIKSSNANTAKPIYFNFD